MENLPPCGSYLRMKAFAGLLERGGHDGRVAALDSGGGRLRARRWPRRHRSSPRWPARAPPRTASGTPPSGRPSLSRPLRRGTCCRARCCIRAAPCAVGSTGWRRRRFPRWSRSSAGRCAAAARRSPSRSSSHRAPPRSSPCRRSCRGRRGSRRRGSCLNGSSRVPSSSTHSSATTGTTSAWVRMPKSSLPWPGSVTSKTRLSTLR